VTGRWPPTLSVDDLAISQLIEPRDSPSLAEELGGMPHSQAWDEPQPYLAWAAGQLTQSG
jgi:hypothetical protein